MSNEYMQTQARLSQAVRHAEAPLEVSVLDVIAKRLNVARTTLRPHLAGGISCSARSPTNRKMTSEMEKGLVRYIKTPEQMGVAATVEHVRKAALSMLGGTVDAEDPAPSLSRQWDGRFYKRNNMYQVNQKSREVARVVASDPRVIHKYFMDFRRTREEYGVLVSWLPLFGFLPMSKLISS